MIKRTSLILHCIPKTKKKNNHIITGDSNDPMTFITKSPYCLLIFCSLLNNILLQHKSSTNHIPQITTALPVKVKTSLNNVNNGNMQS